MGPLGNRRMNHNSQFTSQIGFYENHSPRITAVSVVGSFQNPATKEWDRSAPALMTRADYTDSADSLFKGDLYSHRFRCELGGGHAGRVEVDADHSDQSFQ